MKCSVVYQVQITCSMMLIHEIHVFELCRMKRIFTTRSSQMKKKKNNVVSACIRPVISALSISQIFIVTGGAEFGGHFVTFMTRR